MNKRFFMASKIFKNCRWGRVANFIGWVFYFVGLLFVIFDAFRGESIPPYLIGVGYLVFSVCFFIFSECIYLFEFIKRLENSNPEVK